MNVYILPPSRLEKIAEIAVGLLALPLVAPAANPFLPLHEYIPDAEPRVFGDRVYIYGSHDRARTRFCDTILKAWSAPLSDLDRWTCHGVVITSRNTGGHPDDIPWSHNEFCAPDVVEHRGKYYLFAQIVGSPMTVAVSDSPAGPFNVISQINRPEGSPNDYITYHRQTNNTNYSRRTCVEPVKIEADGSIKEVEQSSLGFEENLNPYRVTPADIACVFRGGSYVTEENPLARPVKGNRDGCVVGYKYFDFGPASAGGVTLFHAEVQAREVPGRIEIWAGDPGAGGEKIGEAVVEKSADGNGGWQCVSAPVRDIRGRHAVYLKFASDTAWREIADLRSFAFGREPR